MFTELYTTYVKVFTGRFHIRYSFNYDTEYNYIIGSRYIIIFYIQTHIHTIHIILYSMQKAVLDQEEDNQEGKKGERKKQEGRRGCRTYERGGLTLRNKGQKIGRKFV